MAIVIASHNNEHEFIGKIPSNFLDDYDKWIKGRPEKDEILTIYGKDSFTSEIYLAKVVDVNNQWKRLSWKLLK